MKKLLTFIFCSLILNLSPFNPYVAQAQEDIFQNINLTSETEEVLFTEIISSEFNNLSSPSIFKANPQFNTDRFEEISYKWDFGDGNSDFGQEVVHTYDQAGLFSVTLTVIANEEEWVTTKEIFIAEETALLITDNTEDTETISEFIKSARNKNYYINIIESFASQSDFLSEEVLTRKLVKIGDQIKNYDIIIVWTDSTSPLNALSRYLQTLENQGEENIKTLFSNKSIILIRNDLSSLQKATRVFNQIQPKEVIAIQKHSRVIFLDSSNLEVFKSQLTELSADHKIITDYETKISPFNVLSYFIDYLITQGIPDNTILLILLLPIIATIIAVLKQVVGISTLGIYMPSIITMAFLILGLKFGLITLLFVIATGIIAHKILNPFKLLYVPKMALVITTVTIALFLLITFTVYFKFFAIEFISLTIFPVLVMGTLTERFARITTTKGLKGSINILSETIIVCVIAYFLTGGVIDLYFTEIQFNLIQNLVLNHPEVIILVIAINAYLGKWTGLQLAEVVRFRHILNDLEE